MSKLTHDSCIIYVGPSLHGVPERLQNDIRFEFVAPVKRGSIEQLVASRSPSRIAIVDGTFHQYPSVGHTEILNAIHAGWEIWGLSSMGAIRACEMSGYGMKGFGDVWAQYMADDDLSDDEVTLVHEAEFPFRPISEPMIHIRYFLKELYKSGAINEEIRTKVSEELKHMWYGYRTLQKLKSILLFHHPKLSEDALDKLYRFEPYRLKTYDLIQFLQSPPWE